MKMETDMLCKKEVRVMIGFNVLITIMVNLNIKDFIKNYSSRDLSKKHSMLHANDIKFLLEKDRSTLSTSTNGTCNINEGFNHSGLEELTCNK